MAFWGVEVKPGKSFSLVHDSNRGALRITQATLGNGTASKRTVVQCVVGDQPSVLLCSLLPDKSESCSLDLEFEEEDEVLFSVVGPRSVHLTGYFVNESRHGDDDDGDSDSYEENVWEMGSDDSGSGGSEEYGEDFMSGSDEDINTSPNRANSGVVIEELSEDERPSKGNPKDEAKVGSQNQIVKYKSPSVESEDEDGFPVTVVDETRTNKSSDANKSSDNNVETGSIKNEKPKKKKKKDKAKKASDEKKDVESNQGEPQNETVLTEVVEKSEDGTEKQKKKNKKKKAKDGSSGSLNAEEDQPQLQDKINGKRSVSDVLEAKNTLHKEKKARENDSVLSESKKNAESARKPRTFPNGLVIEELSMGQPNGKRASPGKTVSVHYIGKLKNGKIFDSNIGQRPFKFRLGVGQVIKGWDVGVDGMRVGDKRRLTIPPSMGYGQKGAGNAIPGNSWLLFDVELVDVK